MPPFSFRSLNRAIYHGSGIRMSMSTRSVRSEFIQGQFFCDNIVVDMHSDRRAGTEIEKCSAKQRWCTHPARLRLARSQGGIRVYPNETIVVFGCEQQMLRVPGHRHAAKRQFVFFVVVTEPERSA